MTTPRTITVIVRYDDFFSSESAVLTLPELRRVELGLACIHQRPEVPAVIGVVPAGITDAPEDGEVLDAIALAVGAGSEVALHGYDHVNTLGPRGTLLGRAWTRFCQRTRSEFAGLPVEEQVRRIQAGRARLRLYCRAPVSTFIPPWNAYDRNTVEACRRTGLRTLSASRAWPVPCAPGIALIPQTVCADDLEGAVDHALRQSRSTAIVCVAHTWDFTDRPKPGRITLESWKSRLTALAKETRIVIGTLDRLSESARALLTASRLRRHRFLAAALRLAGQVASRRKMEVRRSFYPMD